MPDDGAVRFGSQEESPKLFIVSVCDGIGALFEAISHYTQVRDGWACEREAHLRELVRSKWPSLKASARLEDLKAADIEEAIDKAKADMVLLGGGPPCQPFSELATAPKGLADERSAPLREFARLKGELSELCKKKGITFRWFMEEVASMSSTHRTEISTLLGAEPVLLHAADFGVIHRARLYWGLDVRALEAAPKDPTGWKAVEFYPPGKAAEGLHVVRWCGKADPLDWKPDDGFEWRYRCENGTTACTPAGTKFTPTYPKGRFAALTTIFPHPADRPPKGRNDPDLYQRFLDDERRRPLFQYARGNVVWKDNEARPLNPEESEDVSGFPRGYTAALKDPKGGSNKNVRLSALGNSFHVPSIILILALLFNPTQPAEALHSAKPEAGRMSQEARDRWEETFTTGTIWEHRRKCKGTKGDPTTDVGQGRSPCGQTLGATAVGDKAPVTTGQARSPCEQSSHPVAASVTTGTKIVAAAAKLFERDTLGPETEGMLEMAASQMDRLPLGDLTNFSSYLAQTGAPGTATGPDIQALWSKSPMHAAVGKQHRPSTSYVAQDRLVARGVGPERHVAAAQQLPHPFAADPPTERDMAFAVEANVRIGPNVKQHRRKRLRILQGIAKATDRLDEYLRDRRPIALEATRGPAPMFVAVMVVLLRWPDTELPQKLARGFELADQIAPANIFRPCEPKQVGKPVALQPGEELLGQAAVDFVDELELCTKTSDLTQVIYELTEQEIDEGLAEPMRDRGQMDDEFGYGGWRPLPRHVIWQGDKWRPIDDGKRARTNALTQMSESVVCIPPEFVLLTVRAVMSRCEQIAGHLPEWAAAMRFATEDWWKGFRQLAPRKQDRGLAVVAIQVPDTGQWKYVALKGMPFGLGAAVNQFNRLPMLATAIGRRILYLLMGHYVDDNVAAEFAQLGGDAQAAMNSVMDMLGVKLSETKRQEMTCMGMFLGHLHDMSRIQTDQAVCYGPKPKMREHLIELIDQALKSGRLTSGTAAKMRGIATWLDTGMAGRPCRGALTALTARQYWESREDITENLELCLRYLRAAAAKAPDRALPIRRVPKEPVIVYTDAADEKGQAKLGGIVYAPGQKPHIMTWVVPSSLRAAWGDQKTIINQAELVAAPILAATVPELLRDQDVLWLIDNTSAEAALIKAGSPTETMCQPALRASAMLAGLRARVWYEHVPSLDNPADVLSREALEDKKVKDKVNSGEWVLCEPTVPELTGPPDFDRLWEPVSE